MNLALRYHLNMYMSVCGGGNYVLGIDDYKIRVLDTTNSELCFEKFADKENKNAALNVNRKEKKKHAQGFSGLYLIFCVGEEKLGV